MTRNGSGFAHIDHCRVTKTVVQEWEVALFVIEFLPKVRLIGAVEPEDLEWTRVTELRLDSEAAANDAVWMLELDDPSYVYRAREVAA